MLAIRLQRTGRKNDASFRVIVTESRNAAKSRKFVEIVGTYEPKKGVTAFEADRIKYWMKNGAKLSDTVHNFMVKEKIIEGKMKNVLSKKSPTKKKKELKSA